jgi:hypothetical protein
MTKEYSATLDPYKVDIGGTQYHCVRGSDVDRDGMYLELSHPNGSAVLEIFYSDKTGDMTVGGIQESIPLDVVEWLIAEAKRRLPPIS